MIRGGSYTPSGLAGLRIYHNTKGYREKDIKKILAETGGSFLTNGPIFLSTLKACCHLKAGGTVICKPAYSTYGIAWNTPADYGVSLLPNDKANYVETVELIVGGKKVDKLHYGVDMAYACARTVYGTKNGRFAYLATQNKYTPEQLRDFLLSCGWDGAVMLDGGGSTCYCDNTGVIFYGDAKRVIPYYIVVTLRKDRTTTKKTTGTAGLTLIKQFEGCRLKAYKPISTERYYTIGWGHYGADVQRGESITRKQADDFLVSDLKKYEAYVNNSVYCPVTGSLTQNQFDALVSFCYNCGVGCLKTLCKGRTATQIAASMLLYNKSGGKALAGLTRRRTAEQALFRKE